MLRRLGCVFSTGYGGRGVRNFVRWPHQGRLPAYSLRLLSQNPVPVEPFLDFLCAFFSFARDREVACTNSNYAYTRKHFSERCSGTGASYCHFLLREAFSGILLRRFSFARNGGVCIFFWLTPHFLRSSA